MAKDLYHEVVKEALIKDGWIITHDPYKIKLSRTKLNIDLGAEKLLVAEKQGDKIAIEIKTFGGDSFINELHGALGQYLIYLAFIGKIEPNRQLYLAISSDVFEKFFYNNPDIDFICKTYALKILVFNAVTKNIEQWIK